MAGIIPEYYNEEEVIFEGLRDEIILTFDQLHEKLDERKVLILAKFVAFKESVTKITQLDEALEGLKKCKIMAMPAFTDEKERKEMASSFDMKIQALESRKIEVSPLHIKLRWYKSKIEEAISQIDLVEELPLYVNRSAPLSKRGKKGSRNGEFNSPSGVAIDPITEEVYIADGDNSRIQVFDKSGLFLRLFGRDQLRDPWGIQVTNNSVYVTDQIRHCLFKFSKLGVCEKVVGCKGVGLSNFNLPRGLTNDYELLYICDCQNDRIQVYNTTLVYEKQFRSRNLTLPTSIQITPMAICVMSEDDNKIYLFAKSANNLIQTIELTGQEQRIQAHFFFVIDRNGNYIISAERESCIRVFDRNGELKHIMGAGHLLYPKGITEDSEGVVYCVTGGTVDNFQKY